MPNSPAFSRDKAKNIILKIFVIALTHPRRLRLGLGRIPNVERAQIGHLELLGDRAGLPLANQRGVHDSGQIFVQRGRRGADSGLGEVAPQELFFEREERLPIGVGEHGLVG